jgi:uncharacterized protein YjiS (DUF1127 family)
MNNNVPAMNPARHRPRRIDLFTLARKISIAPMVRVVEWQARIRSRWELTALTNHDLLDIGCTRCAMLHEVRKPFWRE